jgi:hypothetical protein
MTGLPNTPASHRDAERAAVRPRGDEHRRGRVEGGRLAAERQHSPAVGRDGERLRGARVDAELAGAQVLDGPELAAAGVQRQRADAVQAIAEPTVGKDALREDPAALWVGRDLHAVDVRRRAAGVAARHEPAPGLRADRGVQPVGGLPRQQHRAARGGGDRVVARAPGVDHARGAEAAAPGAGGEHQRAGPRAEGERARAVARDGRARHGVAGVVTAGREALRARPRSGGGGRDGGQQRSAHGDRDNE